ncbi:4-hydroxy-tetrahydrodipicolinate reductase [uncultured Clostridium sp.]|uniref:4-hydroxy-tetrahydrodipicolinate reductase n=1 Tax=uncultured Clostridium sp. TaxID=59620 RepID=UPI0025E5FBA8|nr:4-hydroxy-tetrahydrodipicolinate reductase [uncultured Clostridium sp.]
MNVLVTGPRGKMGRLIVKMVINTDGLNVVSAVAPTGRDYIGKDVGLVSGLGRSVGIEVDDNLEAVIEKCDVIIDYTIPEFSMEVIRKALKYKKGVVCGTTGFSEGQYGEIREISKYIPLVVAANTSMVVNLMYKLLKISAQAIGNMSDIEIIEMHDRYKKDAPSGTAEEMGEIMANTLGKNLKDIAVFGRRGEGERVKGTVGFHSVRAGDISSSHKVMFGLMGERLEITHHAYNWECFARGACRAALFLKGKKPGAYGMKDVLNI